MGNAAAGSSGAPSRADDEVPSADRGSFAQLAEKFEGGRGVAMATLYRVPVV